MRKLVAAVLIVVVTSLSIVVPAPVATAAIGYSTVRPLNVTGSHIVASLDDGGSLVDWDQWWKSNGVTVETPVEVPNNVPDEWVREHGSQPKADPKQAPSKGKAPVKRANLGKAVKGGMKVGAGAYAVTEGFDMVYTISSGLVHLTPLGSDLQTGSLGCDLSTAFGWNWMCTVKAPDYVPNYDVTAYPAGFSQPPVWMGLGSQRQSAGVMHVTSITTPDFGDPWEAESTVLIQVDAVHQRCSTMGGSQLQSGIQGYQWQVLGQTGAIENTGGSATSATFPADCSTGTLTLTPTSPSRLGYPFHSFSFTVATSPRPTNVAAEMQGYSGSVGQIIYYPPGHELHGEFPGVDPNPRRWFETRTKCANHTEWYSTLSESFTDEDDFFPNIPPAQCLYTDDQVTEFEIYEWIEGTTPNRIAHEVIPGWTDPTRSPFSPPGTPAEFEECAGYACELVLYRYSQGQELNCFENLGACRDWFTQVQNAPDSHDYQCRYGRYGVDINECFVYSHIFQAQPDQQRLADPSTGTLPAPAPGTGPNPGTGPAPGGGNWTNPGAQPGQGTIPQSNDCPPPFSWLSLFNPWWYYKGMTCALEWAFVPKTVPQQAAAIQNALSVRAPFSVLSTVPAAVRGFSEGWGGGCDGLPDFSPIDGMPLKMSCAPPDSPGFRVGYGLMQLAAILLTGYGAWRMAEQALVGQV